ncbi:MAG: abortive infection family protein [Nitrospinae bacterium]|nr:abortive infection family protein [Nitrospinota bacterium]
MTAENRRDIPNSVIGTVADILGGYYFSHSRLNTLFMANGAPGDPPEGNCVNKCVAWLRRCNDTPEVNPIEVLGGVLQEFMDRDFGLFNTTALPGNQEKIKTVLGRNGLAYQMNGQILEAGISPSSRTLADILRARDFSAVDAEFERALGAVENDPGAGITAASSLIEALCKTYIHDKGLLLPPKQHIQDLWRIVRDDLGLNPSQVSDLDQKKILAGLASIVDGVGSLRTHVGSAHGRSPGTPQAEKSQARLAINAAHSWAVYVLEVWGPSKSFPSGWRGNV